MFISPLPTEQKTASGRQKWKPVSESYLKIAGSYGVFDSRFGICVKSYVYRDVFAIIIDFYGELGSKSCFWSKSCFCCSRTACNVSEKTKPAFGLGMFESTPITWNPFFIWSYVRHSLSDYSTPFPNQDHSSQNTLPRQRLYSFHRDSTSKRNSGLMFIVSETK